MIRGFPPVIRSDGLFVRDYFHVDDGAAAYMLLAERLAASIAKPGEAYNFANEEPLSVSDLVQKILQLMGSPLEPDVQNAASSEIRSQYLSAARARDHLGWRPLVRLDEGLARTIDWYREFLGAS